MSDDRAEIRELVENWVVWRDAGDWERFATVWHPEGFMMATWFQGPAAEFIRVSREGFERGVNILHFLGGNSVDLAAEASPSGAADKSPKAPPSGAADKSPEAPPSGAADNSTEAPPSGAADKFHPRAISQTKMTISQRALVHDVECDVVCTGRFYDFLEKREGRWGIVLRQPIYEKDRLDPVDASATLALDASVLAQFPVGYRHLAYAQTQIGYDVKRDMPGLVGPGVQRLYRRGAEWLAGGELGDPLKTVD
jgi:hypothetical protein